MKILLTSFLILTTLFSVGQSAYESKSISSKTKMIVWKIKRVNKLMSAAVYYSGNRPKQWDNFEKLKKIASNEELIALTNHPNGVVRCYSFWALSHRKNVDLFSIVKNHLRDYEIIKTQFGCIQSKQMVG